MRLNIEAAKARARTAWDTGERLAETGDLAGALAWVGRAHRMAPNDQNLCFALARLRLLAGDGAGAAVLFGALARRHGVRECWIGHAAASLLAGDAAAAVVSLQSALSDNAADPAAQAVARRVVGLAGLPGWCGVDEAGWLLVEAGGERPAILLDGTVIRPKAAADGRIRLPRAAAEARSLHVELGGRALLGSPIALAAVRRVEGFAERTDDGVAGWAWHPGAPGRDPVLRVLPAAGADAGGGIMLTATALLDEVDGSVPLARPRRFACRVPAGEPTRVLGSDGQDLLGSPVAPVPARARRGRVVTGRSLAGLSDLAVDVVVPVHRGLRATLDCLASVIATVRRPHRIRVVADACPEPDLVSALEAMAARGAILLIRPPPGRRGFPAAVNAGIRAAAGRHVVLLNADTLVAPGWVERLRAAVCSAPDIGTATPLSNQASIFSYPDPAGDNPAPDLAGTVELAALAARANAGRLVEVPTANGFCMFIRQDCLAETGAFEEVLFAQGYGEENDFTERARGIGWRHVAVPSVFVAHLGGVSFGPSRHHLLQRNLGLLERRHPGYRDRVAAFLASDALAPARRRLDAARFAARTRQGVASVLLVTHGGGGGTARIVAERAAAIAARGQRPVVLRAKDGRCEVGDAAGDTPNLAFVLPAELPRLRALLAAARPDHAELHHLLGHDHRLMRLFALLGIAYDVWVHDYAWFCARLSFVTGEGRFCGEADSATCATCVARWGRAIEDAVAPAALRRRSAADLRAARAVIVPSDDVARRVARHVPGLAAQVRPWQDDPTFAEPAVVQRSGGDLLVAVVGAIGVEKGFDVLLACARDAAARALAIRFVVVGYSVDDDALLATGRVFVTGEFSRGEAAVLIAAQKAHLALLPSVWPETWCYALSDVWEAGLSAALFDIGTPAARVRQAGRGWVLPLGLPARGVNDALMALAAGCG